MVLDRYDFERAATMSISTKPPRSPAGSTTCTVVHAGLFGWSESRTNGPANGKASYCTDTTRSSRDRVDGNVVA
jgi:hypothetical protein